MSVAPNKPFYIEALEELASSIQFRDDPRGVPDPVRGYGNTSPRRCSICNETSWRSILWPKHPLTYEPQVFEACTLCVRKLSPGRCMVHGCSNELTPSVPWKLICKPHYLYYLAYSGRKVFKPLERSVLADLYNLGGEPLHVSEARDCGGFFRGAAALNLRLSLPGVQPVISHNGKFLRLNLRWLRDCGLDLAPLLSHQISYTIQRDLRPISDSKGGVFMPAPSSGDLFAEWLAANLTESEQLFLELLRQMGIASEFQPQVRVGGFIVDFLHCGLLVDGTICRPFIVEIDGSSHRRKGASARDARRTKILESLGYRVVRFKNEAVKYSPASVAKSIYLLRRQDE